MTKQNNQTRPSHGKPLSPGNELVSVFVEGAVNQLGNMSLQHLEAGKRLILVALQLLNQFEN